MLNPSELLLKWIPPIMPDEEIPRYQVIYVSKGVGIVERTLESKLTIPLEPNASHVNAIVRTLMPSDAGRDERHKGLNECQFHLNLTDKRAIFHHLAINPYTIATEIRGKCVKLIVLRDIRNESSEVVSIDR
ncbi:unnamed protein product [Hymenolepis diminuta]|uniref:Fibronectin type-III domain-containing protein n=1 Tax=Hymenolepis diminuta TaxID=6216 RepID=A0A3P7BCJ0_HYMDI|nr:unnamed protein product [Hymenolepis diminuta]